MYDVGPPRVLRASGLGSFMWSDFRRNPRLRAGLGQADDPTEGGECPQPVHYTERDALRNEIKGWTYVHAGQHYHENHPDLKAIYEDIRRRLQGLQDRPKLLRCSNEARSRAQIWIRQLEDLRRKAEKRGTGGPAGCQATTWINVTAPFEFTVHRGPTYTVRPGTTRPDCFGQGGSAPTTPQGAVQSSAPPGSVVIDGVTYPSSAAAAAASSGSPTPTTGGGAPSPGAPPSDGGFLPSLEGSIGGVPTKYLLYGALALLAFRMVK